MRASRIPQLALLLGLILPPCLQAQVQRTFVSAGSGNDTNPCTRTLPCRNFGAAIAQTISGGEVIVLDSGGYGTVSITSSISLISPDGVYAGITASTTSTGISVSAGAGGVVVLRGLTLNSIGSGAYGIDVASAQAVHVERCVINEFNFTGIDFGISGDGQLFVKDTTIRGCNSHGIRITSSGGLAKASLDRLGLEHNGNYGLRVQSNSRVTIRDSVVAGNSDRGMAADGTNSRLTADGCVSANNGGTGIIAGGISTGDSAIVTVTNNTVVDNSTGLWAAGGGTMYTRQNNTVRGNATETNGTLTLLGGE